MVSLYLGYNEPEWIQKRRLIVFIYVLELWIYHANYD